MARKASRQQNEGSRGESETARSDAQGSAGGAPANKSAAAREGSRKVWNRPWRRSRSSRASSAST